MAEIPSAAPADDGRNSIGTRVPCRRRPAQGREGRVGQVAEIVSLDRQQRIWEIEVRGRTDEIPQTGRILFGRRLVGWVTGLRTEKRSREILGSYGICVGEERLPDALVLTVSSEFCPPVGARLSLG